MPLAQKGCLALLLSQEGMLTDAERVILPPHLFPLSLILSLSLPHRCFQNLEWLFIYQNLLKVSYPILGMSEDCLYLNIYAPCHANNGSSLPVRLPAALGFISRYG